MSVGQVIVFGGLPGGAIHDRIRSEPADLQVFLEVSDFI
jgi:hypothetical protein